ncbi:MAG: DUF3343 domain-containing protein [Clostridia bacterium]|nr:DUF3343 domain-containing protein [Clostridia bacterium]
MGNAWIVFASSTSAGRLKKLAFKNGLQQVKLLQTPKEISQNGCTYALYCSGETLPALLALAQEYKIRYGHVYRESGGREGSRQFQRLTY